VPSARCLRIVLAEDGVLLREGLTGLIARFGHKIVEAVGNAEELTAAVTRHRPDLVLTDVRMPPGFSDEGLRAAVALRAADPTLPIVVLSQYVEQTYAGELLGSGGPGGIGYLLKDRIGDVGEFVAALEEVAGGGTVVDSEVVRQLLRRRRDPVAALSPRERSVLMLIAQGRSNAAIARALNLSEAAVTKHIGSILLKFELPPAPDDHRRVLAVLKYLREGYS
jgi:DNA-binding NarL/FixJ family response regulator